MSFDISLVFTSLPRLLMGVGVTLQLLLVSGILGLILAIPMVLMRISKSPFLKAPAWLYIYVFRGTPQLVQLFVVYYGLAQFQVVQQSFLWPLLRDPYYCCILAFGLNSAAYTAEIMRGGIQGVDKGLLEAAWAVGLSRYQRFRYITMPLAIRLMLPAYGNELIGLIKSTALASTVTMLDITGVARTIVAKTFAPYEIFISAAIIYLVLTKLVEKSIAFAERHYGRHASA